LAIVLRGDDFLACRVLHFDLNFIQAVEENLKFLAVQQALLGHWQKGKTKRLKSIFCSFSLSTSVSEGKHFVGSVA
jgi:hypothetical protein